MADNPQWHMKKEINIAHVITTLALTVSGVCFLSDLDKRIQSNTKDINYIKEQRTEDVERLEKQLDKINTKLDTLLVR